MQASLLQGGSRRDPPFPPGGQRWIVPGARGGPRSSSSRWSPCSRVAEAGGRSPWCRPGRRRRIVVSEVQTGGVSASDEFVELANQGATSVDLQGLEIVYATSTGSTVTRKATWTASTILDPGRRILIANAAGIVRRPRRRDLLGWFRGDRRRRRAARRRRERRSMPSGGATRRTRSSRGAPRRRRRPDPASSVGRAASAGNGTDSE